MERGKGIPAPELIYSYKWRQEKLLWCVWYDSLTGCKIPLRWGIEIPPNLEIHIEPDDQLEKQASL